MERITVPGPDGGFSVPAGLEREAAERLGRYEDAHGRLLARQEELAGRMEALKAQGKQKTAQFRAPRPKTPTLKIPCPGGAPSAIQKGPKKAARRPFGRRPSRAHGD